MTLDDLATLLRRADPELVLPHGFANPHSYRGFYDELAFEPAENVTVGSMLSAAWAADGTTYTGYKGGEFTMTGDTPCWLAYEGSAGGEEITPELLAGLLAAGSAPDPKGWTSEQENAVRTAVHHMVSAPAPHPAMAGGTLILAMRPLLSELLGQVDHLGRRTAELEAARSATCNTDTCAIPHSAGCPKGEPALANGPAAHARLLATMLRLMIGDRNSYAFDHETAPGLSRAADELDAYADKADAAVAGKRYLLDAYGRVIREGDTVGGTTSGPYQATISGPILRLGTTQVKVRVTTPGGDGACRPAQGDDKWISASRVFLICRA